MGKTSSKRLAVVVSGYYGFANLGDEAILEQLLCELKHLVKPEDLIVLSANSEQTRQKFAVQAINRLALKDIVKSLSRSQLFISGGGGLFQNTRSIGSILYYGGLIVLAKLLGCRVLIYAQGLGPLKGAPAKTLTRWFFSLCDLISVRDDTSYSLLQQWQLSGLRTADPVWCLEKSALPGDIEQHLALLKQAGGRLIGLSLRPSPHLSDAHLSVLANILNVLMTPQDSLILVALQPEQDSLLLEKFQDLWGKLGRLSWLVPSERLILPSQWLSLFATCDFVIAMRLHALIMSLASAVPVAGITYDPKVEAVLDEFGQPKLNMVNEFNAEQWQSGLKQLFNKGAELSEVAGEKSHIAQKYACQNFSLLAKILNMQSDQMSSLL